MLGKIRHIFLGACLLTGLLASCEKIDTTSTADRHVMVMVAGGRNSLSSYIREDLKDLESGDLPAASRRADNVLLVLSRVNRLYADYQSPCPAVLYRLYRGGGGEVHRDTLKTWDGFTPLFGKEILRDALIFVKDQFPAKDYGLVLSSHSSGWMPPGYYEKPEKFEGGSPQDDDTWFSSVQRRHANVARETFPPIQSDPPVKSIGQDIDREESVEMDLADFCAAIPYKMEYILLDACLNGGVEVAWALREKTRYVGFSPTEVLADGFNYPLLVSRLLQDTPDPETVCRDYMDQYLTATRNAWATITLVDVEQMQPLSDICTVLFEKYRTQLRTLNGDLVQRYYRFNRHFFYDLRDILTQAGATQEELSGVDAALSACIPYMAVTDYFFSIPMERCCGLSMYLPSMGSDYLDNYYKQRVDWNTATHLVN